jgi:3-hydroxyisobutyrate dehydrogenase-like beta-hydroxyacid dehydrogenase
VDGVTLARDAAAAADGSDAVLSLNSASAALEAARAASPGLSTGAVYADLNTAAPALKRQLAELVERFADVALLSAVPGSGIRTPALASGPAAGAFARLFQPLGMPVEVVEGGPGAAATRKLVRSVFMKGLAAAIGEALAAAERLDRRGDVYADIERTLVEADTALVRRLVDGSPRHAARRAEEMAAAAAMLEELGVQPRIAAASEAWLRSLMGGAG